MKGRDQSKHKKSILEEAEKVHEEEISFKNYHYYFQGVKRFFVFMKKEQYATKKEISRE